MAQLFYVTLFAVIALNVMVVALGIAYTINNKRF